MTDEEILQAISCNWNVFPREALEDAFARPKEITPLLLKVLTDFRLSAEEDATDLDSIAATFAMFLLAQFREPQAFGPILAICRLPGEIPEIFFDDPITSDLPSILASVWNGDLKLVQDLIEDSSVNEWVRSAALQSLVELWCLDQLDRTSLVDYFAYLFRSGLKREPHQVWNDLVYCSCQFIRVNS